MLTLKPTRFRQRPTAAAAQRRPPRISPSSPAPHPPETRAWNCRCQLVPIRTVGSMESTQAPSDHTVECPVCQKLFRETAAVKDPPIYSPEHGSDVCVIRLYCDHCDVIHVHTRACNAHGDNLGEVLDTAVIRGAAQIDRFLTRYPQARGIEQHVGSILPRPSQPLSKKENA